MVAVPTRPCACAGGKVVAVAIVTRTAVVDAIAEIGRVSPVTGMYVPEPHNANLVARWCNSRDGRGVIAERIVGHGATLSGCAFDCGARGIGEVAVKDCSTIVSVHHHQQEGWRHRVGGVVSQGRAARDRKCAPTLKIDGAAVCVRRIAAEYAAIRDRDDRVAARLGYRQLIPPATLVRIELLPVIVMLHAEDGRRPPTCRPYCPRRCSRH